MCLKCLNKFLSLKNRSYKMLNINSLTPNKVEKINHHMTQTLKAEQLPLPDDPRTLQLALELSLVGLNENIRKNCVTSISTTDERVLESDHIISSGFVRNELNTNNAILPTAATSATELLITSAVIEDRSKKSQNMTECVPVPSSEHVAEIVGRQGCKIKALRAKTNTYIKTPVRGEEPVFVVTGRKEDVNKAKREILSAAEHFSLIRASRKTSIDGSSVSVVSGIISSTVLSSSTVTRVQSGPPCLPGQITIEVRVPYRVVGLVVGPKGATIKHIQQETQTYIVTPSREKEPIFEVSGLPENVEIARKQIEAHIALRTGNSAPGSESGTDSIKSKQYGSLHSINTLSQILNDGRNSNALSSMYNIEADSPDNYDNYTRSPLLFSSNINLNSRKCTSLQNADYNLTNCVNNADSADFCSDLQLTGFSITKNNDGTENSKSPNNICGNITQVDQKLLSFNSSKPTALVATNPSIPSQCHIIPANVLTRSCSSASSTASTKSTATSVNNPPEILNIWKNINEPIDHDEGIGDSPSIWNIPSNSVNVARAVSRSSLSTSVSPTDSLLGENNVRHTKNQDSCSFKITSLLEQQRTKITSNSVQRECFVCNEKEVTTALVPCGHNMFCKDCANQICVSIESICPICHSIVYHPIQIIA